MWNDANQIANTWYQHFVDNPLATIAVFLGAVWLLYLVWGKKWLENRADASDKLTESIVESADTRTGMSYTLIKDGQDAMYHRQSSQDELISKTVADYQKRLEVSDERLAAANNARDANARVLVPLAERSTTALEQSNVFLEKVANVLEKLEKRIEEGNLRQEAAFSSLVEQLQGKKTN